MYQTLTQLVIAMLVITVLVVLTHRSSTLPSQVGTPESVPGKKFFATLVLTILTSLNHHAYHAQQAITVARREWIRLHLVL